uniref:uncharacterized protein LOC117272703 isoform X2 n=1 Tax=Epinephelus lanceolatus TaxID=310571 RepID=UPI0014458259|nr:uncharacterized protein LOC117272703 isoform X2 [Epinephelus lanceolatus]
MASAMFALYLTCLCLGITAQTTDLESSSVHPHSGFLSVNTGEDLTLKCYYGGATAARLYWYKQTLGQKPTLISTFYTYDKKVYFEEEFKNSSRFSLDTENGRYHLTIRDLHISDSATYYCISCYLYSFDMLQSTLITVIDSSWNIPALVHQSASETIQPGGSVTLNCTVHTGSCDGEYSVYWFKNSQESHPGLIYSHGGRNDQCERKPDTQTHTCVYNLPMKSLNLSHAGTYYCAVASCGHILFGEGTKLDFEHEADTNVLVYFLSGAITLSVLLAISVCMMNKDKRNNCKSTESDARVPAPSTADAQIKKTEGSDLE